MMVIRSDSAERGTCPGYIFVLNAKGTSFGHVMKASLTYIRAFLTYAQVRMHWVMFSITWNQ